MNTPEGGRSGRRTRLFGMALCVAIAGVGADAVAGAVDRDRRDEWIAPEARKPVGPKDRPGGDAKFREDQERKAEQRRAWLRDMAARAAESRRQMEASAAKMTNPRLKEWFLKGAEGQRAMEKRFLDGLERPFEALGPLPPPLDVPPDLFDTLLPKDFYDTLPKNFPDLPPQVPQQAAPRRRVEPIPLAPPTDRLRHKNIT
ncbi:hypothetical protein TA3x_001854 [Tundrisphaera sp. TA3]|uniref:hypothetical protein n=1 Tax=Tundrisphaera sp. TA3 TaxID=3435775 RepID=UPI003EC1211C